MGSIAQGLLGGLLCFVFIAEDFLGCAWFAFGSILAYGYLLARIVRGKEILNRTSVNVSLTGTIMVAGTILSISFETGFEPVIILLLSGPAILLALYHFLIHRRRAATAAE